MTGGDNAATVPGAAD